MSDDVAEEIRDLHAWAASVVTGYANARAVVDETVADRRAARAAARAARLEVGRRLNEVWPSLRKGDKGPFLAKCGLEERTGRVYRTLAARADSGVPERAKSIPEQEVALKPRRRVPAVERLQRAVAECTPDERAAVGRKLVGTLGVALARSLPPAIDRPKAA